MMAFTLIGLKLKLSLYSWREFHRVDEPIEIIFSKGPNVVRCVKIIYKGAVNVFFTSDFSVYVKSYFCSITS